MRRRPFHQTPVERGIHVVEIPFVILYVTEVSGQGKGLRQTSQGDRDRVAARSVRREGMVRVGEGQIAFAVHVARHLDHEPEILEVPDVLAVG